MAKWAVVSTYYKHGEYSLYIFYSDNALKSHLQEELYKVSKRFDDVEISQSLDDLIDACTFFGNKMVSDQYGWGIREIRKI